MKHNTRAFVCILLIGFLASAKLAFAESTESYGEIVGRKLLSGLGNVATSVVEIPKNIIIVNNESNFAWGLAGGSLKGLVNMIGRIGVGVVDLVTAPIPTYPIVDPLYVWDDFYAETTYGPAFVIE